MKCFHFLVFSLFLEGIFGNNQKLHSFVETIEDDLPSPCQFAESELPEGTNYDYNDLTNLKPPPPPPPFQSYPPNNMNSFAQNSPPIQSYPSIDMNPFVQNSPPIPYYDNQLLPQNAPCPYKNFPPPIAPMEETHIYPEVDPNFEDIYQCDLEVCIQRCREFLQKETVIGSCENNECYCKEIDVPEDTSDPDTAINPTTVPSEKPWTHDSQKDWPDSYPLCGEEIQSPINLKPEDFKDYRRKIKFYNFELPVSFFALNTGNGVRYLLQSSKYLNIGLNSFWKHQERPKNYTLSHIDLHWPYEEHSINNVKSGVMEMQLYFFDSSKFWHYDEASQKEGGNFPSVMALSLIFRLNNENTDIDNSFIDALVDLLHHNKVGHSLPSKPYLEFIPKKINYRFNTYEGTHTTPPCLKGLQWIINQPTRDYYYISTDQLNTLQNVRDHRGERIISNVRDVQK